ncbi:hypothetical protein D3C86_1967510 [compost metagenome]
MPASGRPNIGSTAATTTSEARGTPAMPLLVTSSTSSMVICCVSESWMPYTCATNSAANEVYMMEPSRLNE